MQHTHPLGPRVGGVALREVVHVDVLAGQRVSVGELVDVANEVALGNGVVESVEVGERILDVLPVGVLERDGVQPELVDLLRVLRVVVEQFMDAVDELVVRHGAARQPEQLGELVDEEVGPLVAVAADRDGTLLEGVALQRHIGRLDEKRSVDNGQKWELHESARHPLLVGELLRRQVAQEGDHLAHVVRGRVVQVLEHQVVRAPHRRVHRQRAPRHVGRAALHDGARELGAAERRQEVEADAHRAGTLAEQRHVVRVAAEVADVLLHPLHAHQLVEQPRVARRARVVEREEAERADAVADRHDDDVVGRRQDLAVVETQRRRSAVEPAPEYPHHDGRFA